MHLYIYIYISYQRGAHGESKKAAAGSEKEGGASLKKAKQNKNRAAATGVVENPPTLFQSVCGGGSSIG